MVIFTSRPLYPWGKSPIFLLILRLGWTQLLNWVFWIRDILTCARNRTKFPPFSSLQPTFQPLYRLVVATNKVVYYRKVSAFSHGVCKRLSCIIQYSAKVSANVVNTSVSTAVNARSSYVRGNGSECTS